MEHFLEQCNSATSHFANSGRRLPTHGCEPYDCTPRGAPLKGSSYSVAEPPRNLGGTVARASFSRVQCCTIDPSPPLRIPLPSESSPPEGTAWASFYSRPWLSPSLVSALVKPRAVKPRAVKPRAVKPRAVKPQGLRVIKPGGGDTGGGDKPGELFLLY